MLRSLFFVFVFTTLHGCAIQPQVEVDYDTAFAFNTLQKYAWAPKGDEDGQFLSLFGQRVERAITDNLTADGKQHIDSAEAADFLIAYHLSVEKQLKVDSYYTHWGYRPFWWGATFSGTQTRVREYKTGTLVIDLIDPRTNTVFFSGSVESKVKKNLSPQEREVRIREAVGTILARLPK